MAFLFGYSEGRAKRDPFHGISPEFMAQAGCASCPLKTAPKAEPSGAMPCEVYLLGEAPGLEEAEAGAPFVGRSGKLLRAHIPKPWLRSVRFNNVVKSLPARDGSSQQQPSATAMAHCRGYLTADIEKARPRAIFGFGNVALQALTGESGITRMAGRRLPVRIGSHSCWYFAFIHPAAILHADERQRADMEALFAWQLQAAFARVADLEEVTIVTPASARSGIRVLTDAASITGYLLQAEGLDRVGFDYETNSLSPFAPDAKLLSAAIGTGTEAVAFPLDHPQAGWSENERSAIRGALRRFLEAPVVKIAHKSEFELLWSLAQFGAKAARASHWGDSLVQAFLIDSRPRTHSLDFLCQHLFGLGLKELSKLDVKHLEQTPLTDVLRYNALDAKFCLAVFETQQPVLQRMRLQPLYHHHMARIASLVRGQAVGLPVDSKVNYALTDVYSTKLAEVEQRLLALPEVDAFERAGTVFNVNATKHISEILRGQGIHLANTAEDVLAEVGTPFTKAVLEYRGLAKVLGTYLAPLSPTSPLVRGGRLHPVIGTTNTRTWRTSSEDPNIQNWPQRDAESREVRKQIVAPPGHWLVSVDYSGIQARNVAMESRDQNLVQAFINRYDIHGDWSERIQRRDRYWAADREPKALRSIAKNKLVFPFFFGAQPASVSHNLRIDIGDAFTLYEEFWQEFPDIRIWHQKLRRDYRRLHYVTGLSGFRRPAPISENQLVNTPIQSDEALLVCDAMNRLSGYEDAALQPVMMIHDDLSFFVPYQRLDECMEIILTEMLRCEYPWLNVPLAVEVKLGRDWFEQQPIGQFESSGDGGYVEY